MKDSKVQNFTPMMQQYLKIKEDYKDTIVFFRLGDFYEMFFDDALTASRELEIVLTGRDAGQEERVPMCGVPYHAANIYVERLVEKGYKIAICEQMEDPALAKGIVKREIIKVITPGTVIDEGMIDEKTNNYIVALREFKTAFVIAYCDISTGEMSITELPKDYDILLNEIINLDAKEIIVNKTFSKVQLNKFLEIASLTVSYNDNTEIPLYMKSLVSEVYNAMYLETFGMLANYLVETQKRELMHLQKAQVFVSTSYLKIDNHSMKNLELVETLRLSNKKGTLFWLLDKCQTAMGSRYLKRNILRPEVKESNINDRLDLVTLFKDNFIQRQEIINSLKEIYDLERIVGRISFGNSNAKDLINLARSLRVIPHIKEELNALNNDVAKNLSDKLPLLKDILDKIDNAIVDNPPLSIKEGGIIKTGYNKDLDELRYLKDNANTWLNEFEEKEREKTGIKKLKIGYNRVFGYYIEVLRSQSDLVLDEYGYERKQTLSNAERYITQELKEKENLILGSQEKAISLEYDLFIELRDEVKNFITELQDLAGYIAYIDMLIAFAVIATENSYVRPKFNEKRSIEIYGSRHPVVEKIKAEKFVENDIIMDKDTNILLITGPNMAGKSTYMRQLALIIIMAQIGSYVPAEVAIIPIFDAIFTRIGASDDLVSGQSTFMVEMLEVNYALRYATANSLILFDEIGRGTATYDGMALAEAIIEYAHHKLKCKLLFSTHYHELTFLEDELTGLVNVHVGALEEKGKIVFLHKVLKGPTDKSYGIHVAKLANIPNPVIERANIILKELEKNNISIKPQELDLFDFDTPIIKEEENDYSEVINELKLIDINEYTPMQALIKLGDLIEKIDKK